MLPPASPPHPLLPSSLPARLAALPLPLLLLAMAALWVANPGLVWTSPLFTLLTHFVPVAIGLIWIVIPSARGFLAGGPPAVLMLGCGILLMDLVVLALPAAFTRSADTAMAMYNCSVLLGALCHFGGVIVGSRLASPPRRPGWWLTAVYGGGAALSLLLIWAGFSGWLPTFFVDGQGGTPLRSLVVLTAVGLFLLTAGLLWQTNRRQPSPFLYWYGLGLIFLAAGLTGALGVAEKDSLLQWLSRFTQVLATVYLAMAVRLESRLDPTAPAAMAAVDTAWRENLLLPGLRRQHLPGWLLRHGLAVAGIIAAFGLHQALELWVGDGLPAYLTFYPVVMVAALVGGIGPGLTATAATLLVVGYFILAPVGELAVAQPVDRLGQVIFAGMGLFMSLVAHFYRISREKAAAYDREESLRVKRAALAEAQQLAHLGSWYWDARTDVSIGSDELLRIYGFDPATQAMPDFAAQRDRCYPVEDWEVVNAAVQRAVATGVGYALDVRVRRGSELIWVTTRGEVVRDATGRIIGMRGTVQDISERKRAEEALRQSEERERRRADELAALLDVVPMPVFLVHDPEASHITGNRAADELLQSPRGAEASLSAPAESRPRHFTAFKEGRELPLDELPAQRAARGEVVKDYEFELRFDDGTVLHLLGYGTPLRDEEGRPRGAVHVLVDISERKRAEEAVRQWGRKMVRAREETEQERRLLAAVLEVLPTGVAITDVQGGTILSNRVFAEIWGEARPETRSLADYAPYQAWWVESGEPVAAEEWASALAVKSGEAVTGQLLRIRRFDGDELFVVNSGAPVRDAAGEIIACAVAIQDITQLKRAEAKLRENELRASALINAADESIWLFGPSGEILAANQTAARRLGRSVAEVVGINCRELLPPSLLAARMAKIEEVIRTASPLHFEDERAGIIFDHTAYPVRNLNGAIYGVAIFSRDISERRQAELVKERLAREVQQLADELDSLFAALPVLVSLHDREGCYLRVNPALKALFGFDPTQANRAEVAERLWARLPDGRPLTPENMPSSRVLLGETLSGVEYLLEDAQGREHVMLYNAVPLWAEGQVSGMVVVQLDISERKRAEEALRQSREDLGRAQLVGQIGSWRLDVRRNVLSWSVENHRIFGIPEGTPLTYETFLATIHPEDREYVDRQWQAALGGAPYDIEHRLVVAGQVKWVREKAYLENSTDGALLGGFGITQDITARKLAEEEIRQLNETLEERVRLRTAELEQANRALRQSEDLLNETQLISKVGGWEFAAATGLVSWTEEVYRIHEVTRAEYDPSNPKQDMEFYTPDDRQRIAAAFQAAVTRGEAYDLELQLVSAKGNHLWVRTRGQAEFQGGQVARVYGNIMDISEIKQAQAALQEANASLEARVAERTAALRASEERLRLFIEHAPASLAMFDREMRYLSASRRWLSDYGLGEASLVGRLHYEVFPEIGAEWKEVHQRALAGEVIRAEADRFARRDGTAQWLRWEVRPWYNGAAEIGGIVVFSEDITARLEAEGEIRALNEQLGYKVTELEAANRELEGFTYSVSHDLRAPIRHIAGFSQLLEKRLGAELNAEGRNFLAMIGAAANKLGVLVDELLEFSRMGRQEIGLAEVDLGALVGKLVERFRQQTAGRRIDWRLGELPVVQGDPTMLRFVLENLLANAVKFTATREEARIEIGHREADGQPVIFVKDNGVGFDMAYYDKLFGVFQRLHSNEEFAGTGIGLANVRRIIQRHGGEVWAEARVDGGATFFFSLPRQQQG